MKRDINKTQIKESESAISKLRGSLDYKLQVLTRGLHDANTRIDQPLTRGSIW